MIFDVCDFGGANARGFVDAAIDTLRDRLKMISPVLKLQTHF
jgi:hypothetical protein